MKLQVSLTSGLTAVLVSAYAPTMTATEDEKEPEQPEHCNQISSVQA